VNAPHLAEERGIELLETRDSISPDFTELIVVRLRQGEETTEVAGTGVGPRNIPYLARVWQVASGRPTTTSGTRSR